MNNELTGFKDGYNNHSIRSLDAKFLLEIVES